MRPFLHPLRLATAAMFAFAFALAPAAFVCAADSVVATDKDGGKTVTVPVGTPLVVELTGHHGSGYYWRLDSDLTPQLVLSGRTTKALDLPGAPEMTTFTFTTQTPGSVAFKASNLKAGAPIPQGDSDVSFTVEVK
jgi:hypothetical protein